MGRRDYLELAFRSIQCFADDGKLDVRELQKLIDIAKRDGVIDEDEKRVLANIISRVREEEIDVALQNKISELEAILV